MTASLLLRAQAYNNAWANYRLLRACAALSAEDFSAPRVGFFPSLAATLNHNLIVDWFYVDALEGGTLGHGAFASEIPHPGIAGLTQAQRRVDARLIALCESLTDASLGDIVAVHRGPRVQQARRDRLLLHLFQHQIHHRGQAHAMLAGTAVKPPQLDEFFAEEEAHLRAADFEALGFSEGAIWNATGD